MNIVNPDDSTHTIKYIPRRFYEQVRVKIENVSTNEVTYIECTPTFEGAHEVVTFTHTFTEGDRYKLNVYSNVGDPLAILLSVSSDDLVGYTGTTEQNIAEYINTLGINMLYPNNAWINYTQN